GERHWTMGRARGETKERDLSWLDSSEPYDISADGKTLLFSEFSDAMGANYAVCIRKTDGSSVVRLGEGQAIALSPDAKWALSTLPHSGQLSLLPTRVGEAPKPRTPGIRAPPLGGFPPHG